MEYSRSQQVAVDPERLKELAVQMAAAAGFVIESQMGPAIELRGPGMQSSRQNPLCGASRMRWVRDGRAVTLEAELGGAKWMARFVKVFPLALTLGLVVVLGVVFAFVFDPQQQITTLAALGAIAVFDTVIWLVLGPVMARGIENRTRQALDSYFTNVVTLASRTL